MKGACVISVVAAVACAFASHARDIVLVTTGSTPPFSYQSDSGEIIGIEIDIAREAAEILGCSLSVKCAEFNELLPMVSEGKADIAAATITISEGRRQAVDFTIPYAFDGTAFLYRTGEEMPTMIVAERIRVGTIDSSLIDFYLCEHNIDPVRYATYEEGLADLVAKRKIDAFMFDASGIRNTVAESGGTLSMSRLEKRDNYGLAVRKGNEELKRALDDVIARRRGISTGRRGRGRLRGRDR